MARFEVITGPERRRRWSEDQKRAIVAESFAPGAVVSDVARRADISAGQIYRWRQELRGHCQVEALQRRLGAMEFGLMPRWSPCAIALLLLTGRCEASTGRRDGAGG